MATTNGNGRHLGKHAASAGEGAARRPDGARPAGKRFRSPDAPATAPRTGTARKPRFRAASDAAPAAPEAPGAVPRISSDAPRPVEVEGAFSTISSEQGAVLHDRESASEAASAARSNLRRGSGQRIHESRRPQVARRSGSAHASRPMVIGLVVVGLAVVGAVVAFVATSLLSPSTSLESDPDSPERVEQVQADKSDGIQYDGYTYACNEDKDKGGYAFVRYAQGSNEPLVLFQLQGTPVTEVLYNGAFVIPQNLGESWNVVAWTMGDGSEPTALTNEDGSPVEGDGSIASATLDGSNLVLSFDNDATMTVPLG